MSEPKAITDVINAIEAAERGPDHPRSIARQAVAQWRSDAQRNQLPVTNQHDDKGAPVLDVSATLGYSHHNARLGKQ